MMKIRCIDAYATNPRLQEGEVYEIDARRDIGTDFLTGKLDCYYVKNAAFHPRRFEVVEG